MFDYLPQLMVGFFILIPVLIFCQIMVIVWRWIGRNFFFKTPLEPENMPEVIWMKTAPILIYCIIQPIPMIAVLGIWDIKSVSEPATYFIGLIIGSPFMGIGSLLIITTIHITLLKVFNRETP